MEGAVGQVGDLDATQVATEVGDHFGDDVMSHGSWVEAAERPARHSDCLGFEGADPHWQHALPIPFLEQEQRRDARGNHTQASYKHFDHRRRLHSVGRPLKWCGISSHLGTVSSASATLGRT